jgi:putative LysE/RhtB family amino acid efflux pump
VELLALGFGLGLAVAMQPGPMSVWLLRSTLAGGVAVGAAIGAGIALVDTCYALLGATGASALLAIDGVETVGGLLGAAALVVLGLVTLRSLAAVGAEVGTRANAPNPRTAFVLSVLATLANPTTIASWAAIFAAASVAASVDGADEVAQLVIGVGLGSAAWFTALVAISATIGERVGRRTLQAIDLVAGIALITFGVALGIHVM